MRTLSILFLFIFILCSSCNGQQIKQNCYDDKKTRTHSVIDSVALKATHKRMKKKIIVYINNETITEDIFLQFKGNVTILGQTFLISEMNANHKYNYYFRVDTTKMEAILFKEIHLARNAKNGILAPTISVTYDNYKPNYTRQGIINYLYKFNKKSKKCDLSSQDIFKVAEFIHVLKINKDNVRIFNDIAYYAEKCEDGDYLASYILETIIAKFPDRTVAYLNLGDAYWGLANKYAARKIYQTYVKQMKAAGKASKIPQRVTKRLK